MRLKRNGGVKDDRTQDREQELSNVYSTLSSKYQV